MSAVYGFYYNNKLKITHHNGSDHPKSLGYALFKTLYYAWPQEIMFIFSRMRIVNAYDKPSDFFLNQFEEKIGIESESAGWKFQKPLSELTFFEILSQIQADVFTYFIFVRHAGLMFMLDGFENIKTWGMCDWAYIYNLNQSRIEVWKMKEIEPSSQQISYEDDMDRIRENFDLIHTMIHDQTDLGRNQFDLSGMDYAYDLVYNQ